MIILIVVGVFVSVSGAIAGTTYYVDPDGNDACDCNSWDWPCETIEGAINKSSDSDVIEVNEGTYEGRCSGGWQYAVDPKGKKVVIKSTDPNDTDVVAATKISPFCPRSLPCGMVQADGLRRSCNFADANETLDCKLMGFTILTTVNDLKDFRGGIGSERATIKCYNGSSPTIAKCVFRKEDPNDPNTTLAGIHCEGSGALVVECNFVGNDFATFGGMGAIYIQGDDSDVEIESCHILDNNRASIDGIHHLGGDLDINNCTISGNTNYALYSHPFGAEVNEADVTIRNSTISENAYHGLYFDYDEDVTGTITISNCTIADNNGSCAAGIRVNAPSCTVVIKDCNLTGNTTTNEGGAVHLRDYNDALITGCIITGNSSGDAGGVCLGVDMAETGGGPTLISECVVSDNIADRFGGGIECWNAQLTVENCTIAGNKALGSAGEDDNGGGGIGSVYGLDIINCLIVGNKTKGYGGGVDVNDRGDSVIRNCTIADNFAAEQGGGIYIQGPDGCDVDLKNSIVWYNTADDGNDQIFNHATGGSLVLHISYTDGQGSGGSGNWQWDPNWDDGDNIDVNPWFVGRGYWACAGNGALEFDGDNDYVDCEDSFESVTESSAKTIMAWVKPYSADSATRLITFYKHSSGASGFALRFAGSPAVTWSGLYVKSGGVHEWLDSGVSVVTDERTHVALVQDGTDVDIYINGTSKKSASNAINPSCTNPPDATIGAYVHGTVSGSLDGTMDQVMVFDRALSGDEVDRVYRNDADWVIVDSNLVSLWRFDETTGTTATDSAGYSDANLVNGPNWTGGIVEVNDPNASWVHGDYHLLAGSACIDAGDPNYAAGPNETDLDGNPRVADGDGDGNSVVDMGAYEYEWGGPVSWWKFDETSGPTGYDSMGYSDGTLVNGPNWTSGLIDGALEFYGADEYVDCGSSFESVTESSTKSITAWIKPDSASSTARLITLWKNNSGHSGFALRFAGSPVTWSGLYRKTVGYGWVESEVEVAEGVWTHIALVQDGCDVDIYVNGVSAANASNAAGPTVSNPANAVVGAYVYQGVSGCLDGKIDDVRIYERALSAEEVEALHEAGSGG